MTVVLTQEVPARRPKITDRYVLVFDEGIDRMVEAGLTPTEWRVFFAVLKRSRTEGWQSKPEIIAKYLGIDVRRVHRALARLEEEKLIARPEWGMLQFEPSVAWRGSAPKRAEALAAAAGAEPALVVEVDE